MRPRGLLARGSGGNAANRWHQHYQRPPCSVAGECAVVTRSCCRRLLGGGGSLTRGCGAVLTVLRGPPARGHGLVLSPSGSQIALAGSRPTGGTCPGCESGQVDARVVVPVDDQATLLAVVGALGQGQVGFLCPAGRASLRRRIPPVSDHQRGPVPLGLVGQLAAQLT